MKKLILALTYLFLITPCQAITIIVDSNGTGDYPTIQAAINDANNSDIIELQPGTYIGDGNRDIDFLGKAIIIRSENGPESCIIDCKDYSGGLPEAHRGFHFYSSEDANSVLDGLTITNGLAWFEHGGGILCENSSPTIRNCIITGNSADVRMIACGSGGGMANFNSNPSIINCKFIENVTECYGAGIYNHGFSNPTIQNCIFNRNWALNSGGGICNFESNPTVTNCIFSGNGALGEGGGGMYNSKYSSPTIINCTFNDNWADFYGGGIYNRGDSTVSNCILWGNTAPTAPEIFGINTTVSYSDLKGGWPGTGNIDADPCFVDANNSDYHLKSEGWRWDSVRRRWDYDDVTSWCIDAGNPGCALADELLSVPDDPNNIYGQNIRINMGAYGGTAEASMPPLDWRNIGDLTNDWGVDFNDMAVFSIYWLESGQCIPSDLNRNQSVNFTDFSIFADMWSQ